MEPTTYAGYDEYPTDPLEVTTCCARFDPTPWRERVLHWNDKLFVKVHLHSLFHMPLGIGRAFERVHAQIEQAGAGCDEPFVLSDELSPWAADYYFPVSKEVPGQTMVKLSGTYLTRVFEGPYRDMPYWMEAMREHVVTSGATLDKVYGWYTTCPRCAKAFGENYVVLLAKVALH